MGKIWFVVFEWWEWKDQQIVSEAWVRESIKSYAPKEERIGFGYCWWVHSDMNMYAAEGWGGHALMIFPKEDLIIVHRTDTYVPKPVDWEEIKKVVKLIRNAKEQEKTIDPGMLVPFEAKKPKMPIFYNADPVLTAQFEKHYDNNGDPMTIKKPPDSIVM